jgi:hypothetical protein
LYLRGYRNHPLTDEQKSTNHKKSITRTRVEHVYGDITKGMNGMLLRGVELLRIYDILNLNARVQLFALAVELDIIHPFSV